VNSVNSARSYSAKAGSRLNDLNETRLERRERRRVFNSSVLLALLCAALCVACLAAVFFFVKHSAPVESDAASFTSLDDGRFVAVYGRLAAPSLRETGFFALVCSDACVSFSVPPALAREITGSRVDLARLRSGARVRVEGVLREGSGGGVFRIEAATLNSIELLG
jgi:hypothetical protein